jgi:hypothetical protein
MKFQNYLNEDKIDTIIKEIKNKCKPFLKDWNKLGRDAFLYSGRSLRNVDFSLKKIRKDRTPKDMPLDLHVLLDNWFYKKFGVKARSNSIFVTFYVDETTLYGEPYMIFPIGKYTAISSAHVRDLYNELSKLHTYYFGCGRSLKFKDSYNKLDDKNKDFLNDKVIELLDKSKYEKGLKIQKGYEIMVITDECFIVSMKYQQELLKALKE